jgi:hypothetical protein
MFVISFPSELMVINDRAVPHVPLKGLVYKIDSILHNIHNTFSGLNRIVK